MAEGRVPDDLKPCPFCGKEPKIFRLDLGTWIVGHFECLDMTVSTLEFREEENAIAAWNTRVGTAEGLLADLRADAHNLKSPVHAICNANLTETLAAAIEQTQKIEQLEGLLAQANATIARLDGPMTKEEDDQYGDCGARFAFNAITASRISGGAK